MAQASAVRYTAPNRGALRCKVCFSKGFGLFWPLVATIMKAAERSASSFSGANRKSSRSVKLDQKHGWGLVGPDNDVVLPQRRGRHEKGHRGAGLAQRLLGPEAALFLKDAGVGDIEELHADTAEGIQHADGVPYSLPR